MRFKTPENTTCVATSSPSFQIMSRELHLRDKLGSIICHPVLKNVCTKRPKIIQLQKLISPIHFFIKNPYSHIYPVEGKISMKRDMK